MGGLRSGRARKHACMTDCLVVDLAVLKKQKLLAPGYYHMKSSKWTESNFIERKEHTSTFGIEVTAEQVALHYQTSLPDSDATHDHTHTVQLTSTACNYGGARLWFLAPCCGARVRVIYINLKQANIANMTPQCRKCLELHYPSQLASYQDRHKTYERYLLANYGYTWAAHRYEYELEQHYLPLTPKLELLRIQSQLDRQTEILTHLMRTNRFFRTMHVQALDSLKSEEDQLLYTVHTLKEWGVTHVREVAERLANQDVRCNVEMIIDQWEASGEHETPIMDLGAMIAMKKQLEEEIETLKAA